MTQEEKAQAYDEALKRARKEYKNHKSLEGFCKILLHIFPELKESEDERIRKGIKSILEHYKESGEVVCPYPFVSIDEALVWLEKQGEQKPVVIIPKFRIGDSIKTANEEPLTITKIDGKGYWSEDLLICGFDDAAKWELVEQKPAWSEEDNKWIESLMQTFEDGYFEGFNQLKSYGVIDWLKSLKQRIGG